MERLAIHSCFGGAQEVWQHTATTLGCTMRFAIYLPPQAKQAICPVLYWLSGLTCTEQNFITKAGAQRYATEQGIILVAADTSPRGEDVPNDSAYDLGQGASFYINATKEPWARNFRMYDYVTEELPALIESHFPASSVRAISGHSMGGHGALLCALKKPQNSRSVSAFAPIVAPSQVPWGKKAFTAYLGPDRATWKEWDACELVRQLGQPLPIKIDQGQADEFLEKQIMPQKFIDICAEVGLPLDFNLHPDADHSYYFIASLIGEHIRYHAHFLR